MRPPGGAPRIRISPATECRRASAPYAPRAGGIMRQIGFGAGAAAQRSDPNGGPGRNSRPRAVRSNEMATDAKERRELPGPV